MEGDVDDDLVTDDDVATLNRAAVDRSAVLARYAGAGLVVVGAFAALGWVWMTVRTQQQLDEDMFLGFGATDEPLDAKVRLDQFALNLWMLAVATGVVGLGVAVRLLADYAQSRQGGSITGFQVGDRFTDDAGDGFEPEPDA